jgi:hypothetical protein
MLLQLQLLLPLLLLVLLLLHWQQQQLSRCGLNRCSKARKGLVAATERPVEKP